MSMSFNTRWLIRQAVTAFVLLLVLTGTVLAADKTPPQQTIDAQINAFLADRHDEAYSYAAPNVRMVFPTVESFMGMVQGGYQPVYRPKTWSHARTRTENGVVFQEVLITDMAGKNWAALYTLQQQPDGSWKITGVGLREADSISM
jgi:hypothetical protein